MEDDVRYSVVEKLVGLSEADWKYADLYLRDAEGETAQFCSPERHRGLLEQRNLLPKLSMNLRRAIRQGDWRSAERLAGEGGELRRSIESSRRIVSLAQKVYGERSLTPSSTALALSGSLGLPAGVLKKELAGLVADLRFLAALDLQGRDVYGRRAAELDRAVVDLPAAPPPRADPSDLREAALAAAGESDFAAVLRIARGAARTRQDRSGRVRAPRPVSRWVDRLADPFPDEAVARARGLGLEPALLEPNEAINAYLGCCCADAAVLPEFALSEERRKTDACTCGHVCPPEIRGALKSSLDALMVHPFLTTGGTRYIPWWGPESLLVETFSEEASGEPSPLLEALSLPRRGGLARLTIENALLSKGLELCEALGLEPGVYRVACIPFDAYNRLADRFDWGARELWTHFDGYQVNRERQLQAMVGGDVRFGGADDLCGVGRAYDSDHIRARFVVVRRDRFEARTPEHLE